MTAILAMFAGAGIGAVVAIALYVLGFGVEFLNCACHIITCDCSGERAIPAMWEDGSFLSVLLFCTIAGAVVGLIYGICKMKIEKNEAARLRDIANSEEAKKQRIKLAKGVKQKAVEVANICEKNVKNYEPLITPTYKSDAQMDVIIREFADSSELKGEVDAIVNEIKLKGGASK